MSIWAHPVTGSKSEKVFERWWGTFFSTSQLAKYRITTEVRVYSIYATLWNYASLIISIIVILLIIIIIFTINYFFLLIDAGAPVYMYEFQHSPSLLKKNRPSFVGCDHGDDMIFVLGYCFGRHLKVQGLLLFIY